MKYSISYTPTEYNHLDIKVQDSYRFLYLEGKPSESQNINKWASKLNEIDERYQVISDESYKDVDVCLCLCVPSDYIGADIKEDVRLAKQLMKLS